MPPVGGIDRQFKTGDVIAARFVIVRFLAKGGMGEVYEAVDQHLQGKHIALKTLRSDAATDPDAKSRFEREVLLAREIRHPNVCPPYELFRADGERGPVLFLTMKLLHGESLGARLNRAGSLAPGDALSVAEQMAAGLDAAHRAGIVHRDFKPGNIMLEQNDSGLHVSVTDFGLSRLHDISTVTEKGWISGTPGYIAPEVLQGSPATTASDIYAFGVVLFEMITGKRLPPVGIGAHIPKALPPNIRANWADVIVNCLNPDPTLRFPTAEAAVTAITSAPPISGRAARVVRRRRILAIAAGATIAAAVGWAEWPAINDLRHPLPARRFVAVMSLPPTTGAQETPVVSATMSFVATRLVRAERYTQNFLMIASSDIAGHQQIKAPIDAIRLLGANLVLLGSLSTQRDTFQLKLIDAASGTLLRYRTIDYRTSDPGGLGEEACRAAAAMLGIREPPIHMRDDEELRNVSAATFALFESAEDLRRQPNDAGLEAAIAKYEKVLEANPHFALAYAGIAIAYARRYHISHDRAVLALAESNARLAVEYNPDSPRALLSRAMADLYSGKTQQGLDGIGKALQADPANPEILLYQALAFRDLHRLPEEENVYRQLLKQRPNYWPAYNELGWVLYRQGKYRDAAQCFREASVVAPSVALPLNNLGAMYFLLGKTTEAEDAFRQSISRAPNSLAYLNLGTIAFQKANFRQALDYYSRARDLKPDEDLMWRNIADCYMMLGEPKLVVENYQRARDLLREKLSTNPRRGADWMILAFYEAKSGRRAEAEQDIQEAEARGASDIESQFMKAQVLAVLGNEQEALNLVLSCLDKGLSVVEVQLALDLKDVRADPRYKRRVSKSRLK